MPIHGSLFQDYAETTGQDPFTLQNKKMLKVQMQHGPVLARMGAMVAYQGDVRFQNQGTGELFLADMASEIEVMYLENDMISVNGANVLAFSSSIEWDIHRVSVGRASMMAGGMFNVSLRGTGYVAVTTKGDPVALDVAGAPTFADADAVVLWTAGVSMDVRVDTGGMKSMLRGGTGELIQMAFGGEGYVLVQPAESIVEGGHQQTQNKQGGLGGLLGG